jgi:tripartite-type tricarboxylate transporter receptor subunit TctC
MTRVISQQLSERWRQSVVVDNRAGAVGAISFDLAVRAAPDGYTLVIGQGQNITAMLLKTIPVDIPNALVPVVHTSNLPFLLVVTPSLPVTSVKELLEHARQKPLVYASSGTGSVVHLGMELLKSMTGIEMTHVPYKGSGLSMVDLMAGRVQLAITNSLTAGPLAKSGRIRALAVTGARRAQAFPDLPTVSEAGVSGYELTAWYGLFAPLKTPEWIVEKVNRDVTAVMGNAEMKAKLAADGVEPAPANTPAEFGRFVARDVARWDTFLKNTRLKLD